MSSYVIDDRARWDAFWAYTKRLGELRITVGILSGTPRYPAGHRGKSSRDYDKRRALKEPDRFSKMGPRRTRGKFADRRIVRAIRRRDAAGEGISQISGTLGESYRKQLRASLGASATANVGSKTIDLPSKKWSSLLGKGTRGTQVAKVAAVIGQVVRWEITASKAHEGYIRSYAEAIHNELAAGRTPWGILNLLARTAMADWVKDLSGKRLRSDTGLMARTVDARVVDLAEEARITEEKGIAKAARKRARDARYRSRKRNAR
ncbi:MAG: hypothetical protein RBU30_08905 [Polyangia bacterium]|nr:hypothetical protein [Polyangia bacterium]